MPFSFKVLYFCMLVVVPQLLTRDLPRDTTTGLQLERWCGHCDCAVICRALLMVAVVLPRQREVWALGEDQSFSPATVDDVAVASCTQESPLKVLLSLLNSNFKIKGCKPESMFSFLPTFPPRTWVHFCTCYCFMVDFSLWFLII